MFSSTLSPSPSEVSWVLWVLGTTALTRVGGDPWPVLLKKWHYPLLLLLSMHLIFGAVCFSFFTRIYFPCVKIADLWIFTDFFKLFYSWCWNNAVMESHAYFLLHSLKNWYLLQLVSGLWLTFGFANSMALLTPISSSNFLCKILHSSLPPMLPVALACLSLS